MAKYRVLSGTHSEGGKFYAKGEIVDSASDLLEHNSRGSIKFEPVTEGQAEQVANAPEGPTALELGAMKVADLVSFANAEEIDLSGASKKDEIIAAILAATE